MILTVSHRKVSNNFINQKLTEKLLLQIEFFLESILFNGCYLLFKDSQPQLLILH